MAQITTGLRSILAHPWVYKALQTAVGAGKFRRYFIDHCVRPKAGERILDIGCGPGEIVPYLPAGVEYVGYDISPDYIAFAKQRFPGRGEFYAAPFQESELARHQPFDTAIVIAVLHHLDDDAVVEIPCTVDANGALPVAVSQLTDHQAGLVCSVKAVERTTIQAAASGSRDEALRAFAWHPLIDSVTVAHKLLDTYVAELPGLAQFIKH